MAKFRTPTAGSTTTTNYMGAKSYKQSPKEELIFALLTSFIENSYYEKSEERLDRVSSLVKCIVKTDPIFLGKLAVYTRRKFHMRSAFHALVGELAKSHRGDALVQNVIYAGVERLDDLMEIVAYIKKPIPNQVKKGVAKSLGKFNEYAFGKYKGEGKSFSLVDLFNLAHPKPPQGKEDLYKRVIEGKLKIPDTWETRLSAGEDKDTVWTDLIENKKIGYMALLRNLRNIMKTCDSKTVKKACNIISNKDNVLKSKQLPFRFLSALSAIDLPSKDDVIFLEKEKTKVDVIQKSLNRALEHSIENIPLFGGKTMILSDNSGSMTGDPGGASLVSAHSRVKTSDMSNLFAVLYWTRMENTYVGLFGDRLIHAALDRSESIYENFRKINHDKNRCGASTEAGIFHAFEKIIKDKQQMDRIVIFSDMQVGDGCTWYDTGGRRGADFNKLFRDYLKLFPQCAIYSIDLKGYGNKLFADSDKVFLLSGWSNEIFNIMKLLEFDKKAIINEINSIQLIPPESTGREACLPKTHLNPPCPLLY